MRLHRIYSGLLDARHVTCSVGMMTVLMTTSVAEIVVDRVRSD